jgi:hypothetical protein
VHVLMVTSDQGSLARRRRRTNPAGRLPNGRALTNDVFSARVAFLANGKAGSGGLRPHDDLLAEFPVPRPAGSLTGSYAAWDV